MANKTLTIEILRSVIVDAVKTDTHIKGTIDKSIDEKASRVAYNETAGDEAYHLRKIDRTITASVAQQANDVGMQLLQMGTIDALTYLQGSTLPFKDLYINAIQDRQAQMALEQQAQQMQQGMSPEQQQQANDNTQQAQQMLQAV